MSERIVEPSLAEELEEMTKRREVGVILLADVRRRHAERQQRRVANRQQIGGSANGSPQDAA